MRVLLRIMLRLLLRVLEAFRYGFCKDSAPDAVRDSARCGRAYARGPTACAAKDSSEDAGTILLGTRVLMPVGF